MPPVRELLILIELSVWLGLLVTGLATTLLIGGGPPGAVVLLEPQGGLWWRSLALYFVPGALLMGLAAAAVARLTHSRLASRLALQFVAVWVLVAVLWFNRQGFGQILSSRMATPMVVGLAALLSCAAGAHWVKPWLSRILLLVAVGVGWYSTTIGAADRVEHPLAFDRAESSTGERLLVIGLDGADWDFIEPLIERGELPHLARLRDQGVWGELKTIRPTRSAPIWTSVVTGVDLDRHGVINNSVERLRGSFHRLPNALPLPGGLGLEPILAHLRQRGRIAQSTVASFDREVPSFWTIATVNESPVDFVNWWASWPAEQIFGRMVSDRIHFWRLEAKGFTVGEGHITYPDSLIKELSRLVMRPDQVTRQHALEFMEVSEEEFEEMRTTPYQHHLLKSEFKYFYSMFVSNLRIALDLVDSGARSRGPAPDLFVLFRIIDQASHQALQYSELVEDHLGSSAEEQARYGRVVTEAYRAADRAVGMLVESFGPGTVVLLSDHGFELARRRKRGELYDHIGSTPPGGIFIAVGDGLTTGPVEGLSIYDMMPLFLYLKGWPIADDFVRNLPERLVSAERLAAQPIERIETYGTMTVSLPESGPLVADDEMVERLRALGYID